MGATLLYSPEPGGGKATLKDRGDVVLAGTRRVFAHVARKENFSTPHQVPHIVDTFGTEEEKGQGGSNEREGRETSDTLTDKEEKQEGASGYERKTEGGRGGGKRGGKWSKGPEVSAPLPGLS